MSTIKVSAVHGDITTIEADAVIVNLFEGVTTPGGGTGAVDQALGGAISRLITQGEVKGELGKTATILCGNAGGGSGSGGLAAHKVIVVGLGPAGSFNLERVRKAAGSAWRAATASGKVKTVATILHGAGIGGLDPAQCARAVAEGSALAAYTFQAFKSKPSLSTAGELVIVERDRGKLASIQEGVARGLLMADATNFARDMVNTPANHMTPTHMAAAATTMAREVGLECTVLEKADMERLGMGVLLGVAQGSVQPPKLIVLRYKGSGSGDGGNHGLLALVGKGLTFDSGGISLKNRDGMEAMKDDMAGGAAVIAAMKAIAQLKPAADVAGIVPCTENLPSGSALKPGDVVQAMNGKTVEIISTDAEGRLILADAVAYAVSLGASTIVDVATLTGACGVALGSGLYSGLISTCDSLVEAIHAAGVAAGEHYWRLPSDDEYKEQLKSPVADLKNTGGRLGGTITGGLFIGEFAGKTCWAHLDIANTCFAEKEAFHQPKGATGVAARTLAELAVRQK